MVLLGLLGLGARRQGLDQREEAGCAQGERSSHQAGVVGLVLQGEENRDLPWYCCWSGRLQGGAAMGRERGCAAYEGRRLD